MAPLQHAPDRVAPQAGRLTDNLVARLDHLGTLRFSGTDAEIFLQGQLTCDVAGIRPNSSSYGAYCSPKGRMLASFILWRDDQGFAMVLSRELAVTMHKHISRFVLRSKVKIEDTSDSTALVGAIGVPEKRLPAFPFLRLKDGRLLLALPAGTVSEALRGLPVADAALWRWLDIRNGLPLVTAATRDQFVPQMANLELIGGVSFDKGCYTGQEIVARAQHLGQVKRRMFLANALAAVQAGDALYSDDLAGQAAGTVMNAEASPEGGCDLLAIVQIASRERSTVRLGAPDGPALRFLPLPYGVA
ncbi:MAG TPA: folate-binding protein [Burkholderiales bacterium]|nr:folate-binding protein [Burkholderiales bacterium]